MAWFDKLGKLGTSFLEGFGEELPAAQQRAATEQARKDRQGEVSQAKTEREKARLQSHFDSTPMAGKPEVIRSIRATDPAFADELDIQLQGKQGEMLTAYQLSVAQADAASAEAEGVANAPIGPGREGIDKFAQSTANAATAGRAARSARTQGGIVLGGAGIKPTGPDQLASTMPDAVAARETNSERLVYEVATLTGDRAVTPADEERIRSAWLGVGRSEENFDGWYGTLLTQIRTDRNRRAMDLLGKIGPDMPEEAVFAIIDQTSADVASVVAGTYKAVQREYAKAKTLEARDTAANALMMFTETFKTGQGLLAQARETGDSAFVEQAAMLYETGGYADLANATRASATTLTLAYSVGATRKMAIEDSRAYVQSFLTASARQAVERGYDTNVDKDGNPTIGDPMMGDVLQIIYEGQKIAQAGQITTSREIQDKTIDLLSTLMISPTPEKYAANLRAHIVGKSPAERKAYEVEFAKRMTLLPANLQAIISGAPAPAPAPVSLDPQQPAAPLPAAQIPPRPTDKGPGSRDPYKVNLNSLHGGTPKSVKPPATMVGKQRANVSRGRNGNVPL
jgi:hypothetical protein